MLVLTLIKNVPMNLSPPKRLPTVPKFLSKEGKKNWKKFGKKLEKLGLITELDEGVFGNWCEVYAELAEATKQLQTEAFTVLGATRDQNKINPLFNVVSKLREQLDRYGSRFGMSPSARAGLEVLPRAPENPYDQWQEKASHGPNKKKKAIAPK
jgi:P27 family predicted phage terminase small subunit